MHMLGLIYSQIPSLHGKRVQSWVFTKLTVMLFVAFKILRSFIASFSTTTEDWSDLKKQNKTQDQTHFLIY